MRSLLTSMVLGAALIAGPALAESYEDGAKAYNKRDFHGAMRNWQPLAEKGDVRAQFNVGLLHAQGLGTDQSYQEAVKWWRMAADKNNPEAALQLGRVYKEGRDGVNKNAVEAAKAYRKAADLGNAQAQAELGDLYHRGEGVARNDKDAVSWYKKAVAQGYSPAMAAIGALYEQGAGVPLDKAKAYTYFTLAIAKATGREAEAATASRNRVAAALKPEQIKAAREVASTCMAAAYKNCAL